MFKFLTQMFRHMYGKTQPVPFPQGNETEFNNNPTKVRTAAVSEIQDTNQDVKNRGPERAAYDKKMAEEKDGPLSP